MKLKGLKTLLFVIALLAVSTGARAQDTEFAWLSIAPEVGYVHFFEGDLNDSYNARLNARDGFVAKGHVDIFGDGLALELAPVYAFESCGGLVGDFHVFGGEITMVYRFAIRNVYPGIGIGFHGAYVFANDYIKSGTQLYARAPVGLTWYFAEYLGLVVEAGVMFGGTGVKFKSSSNQVRDALATKGDMEFSAGFGLDVLVGLRFP